MTKKTVPCCCLLRSLCTYCQDIKIFFIQLTVHTKGVRMRKNYRPKGESFDMRRQFAYIKHFQKKEEEMRVIWHMILCMRTFTEGKFF